MAVASSRLTVMFEEPFWIGLYEREENGRYEVSKITFGAEPRDYEVYDFMLKNWRSLKFSPSVSAASAAEAKRINPKRMQRLINRQVQDTGIGTKAQQALKLQQEQGKLEHKVRSKEQKEEEARKKLLLHQQKRKEKHKGH